MKFQVASIRRKGFLYSAVLYKLIGNTCCSVMHQETTGKSIKKITATVH